MKLYIMVGVFLELKEQGGPHQEHISKKKQPEVTQAMHKFGLYSRYKNKWYHTKNHTRVVVNGRYHKRTV